MSHWKPLSEFDYGTGEILLLMKPSKKKKKDSNYQGYKVRDDIVCKSWYLRSSRILTPETWDIYDDGKLSEAMGCPAKRDGGVIWGWSMTRTAWDSVIAWMWKRDLIDEYIRGQQFDEIIAEAKKD